MVVEQSLTHIQQEMFQEMIILEDLQVGVVGQSQTPTQQEMFQEVLMLEDLQVIRIVMEHLIMSFTII